MVCPVTNILNRDLYPDRHLNILCIPYDGLFEYELQKAMPEHTFTILQKGFCRSEFIEIINNKKDMPLCPEHLQINDSFDLILCSNRLFLNQAIMIAESWHTNILLVEHVKYGNAIEFDNSIVVHKDLLKQCVHSNLINYYVDTPQSETEKDIDILVIGDFQKENWNFINDLKSYHNNMVVVSSAPYKNCIISSLSEIDTLLSRSKVYINFNTQDCLPQLVLKALAHKCIVVSNNTPLIASLEEQVTLLTNSNDFKFKVKDILLSYNKPTQSYNAYSHKSVIEQWREFIRMAANKVYKGYFQ